MDYDLFCAPDRDGEGAGLEVDLNALEFAAAVVAGGTVVASVGVTTVAAPGFVLAPALAAGGLAVMGFNKRNGHLPFMGKGADAKSDTVTQSKQTRNEVVDAGVPPVTNHAGEVIEIDDI